MIEAMAYNFLPAQRDQVYLMPPSLSEWLPGDHLAFFLLDVVDHLDLSGFYEHYRGDGLGHPAYEPSVMVSVLLYAYCVGERSSRHIERRCAEDVASRVVSANQVPAVFPVVQEAPQAPADSLAPGPSPKNTAWPSVSIPQAAATGSALALGCILKKLPSR